MVVGGKEKRGGCEKGRKGLEAVFPRKETGPRGASVRDASMVLTAEQKRGWVAAANVGCFLVHPKPGCICKGGNGLNAVECRFVERQTALLTSRRQAVEWAVRREGEDDAGGVRRAVSVKSRKFVFSLIGRELQIGPRDMQEEM